MEQRTVSELYRTIASQTQVWVRLCSIFPQQAEGWTLAVLDITAGEPPPDWSSLQWNYPSVVLRAEVFDGETVSEWMRSEKIQLGSIDVPLPPLSQDSLCPIQRRSSGSSGFHGRFAWPYEEWTIPFPFSTYSSVNDELIGDGDTPSFISANIAMAAMLGLDTRAGGGFDARSMMYRQQSRALRITGVHVNPAVIAVDIEGDDAIGTYLELAGNQPGPIVQITKNGSQTVGIPKPIDLPDNSWVVARRNGAWIDRRFLTYPHSADQAHDVDYFVEPLSQLESIIAAGEGPTTEFKVEIPEDKIKMMKSIAAFCNGSGGVLLLGIDDDGTVLGVSEELKTSKGRDTLTNMIRNWVSPVADFEVEVVSIDGNQHAVIAISVNKGVQPPYGAGTSPEKLVYFIRRGATTFAAAPDQVRQMVLAVQPIRSDGLSNILTQLD